MLCATHPTEKNIEDLKKCKMEYDSLCAIILRRKTSSDLKPHGMRKGKITDIFKILKSPEKQKKNCIRKVLNNEGHEIINNNAIMSELKDFYKCLYDNKDPGVGVDELYNYTKNLNIPKLSNDQELFCEGQVTYTGCYNVLDQLKNGKFPGNESLTAEFYKHF